MSWKQRENLILGALSALVEAEKELQQRDKAARRNRCQRRKVYEACRKVEEAKARYYRTWQM